MRRSSRALGTELWREIVERIDEGVIIFSDRGVVIYANDEAARLLNYSPRDVLELEKDDFVALCQLDRLEGAQFASAFLENQVPESPTRAYEVATTYTRLLISPFTLTLENGIVYVLILREITRWRSQLIADTLVSPEMQSPLEFALMYCRTLMSRLESGQAYPYELTDLARIIHSSVGRALELWQNLLQLHSTDPHYAHQWKLEPVALKEMIQRAIANLDDHAAHGFPHFELDFPEDLPAISASPEHLYAGLCALLAGMSERMTRQDSFSLIARHRRRYIQVDLTPNGSKNAVPQGYQFDILPLAVAEQVILRHGGRLWIGARVDQPSKLSFSLPVWSDNEYETH
jgi:signal transduction histidine kinase